ncbi:MAG TPA: Co2+/Mg2+ efflux protein ApaG [Thermoanaerobaculia bacterium]|nr:Co2+/Mg2+ efflux protein ApaG [Thermoanaerobaculia bacterium]
MSDATTSGIRVQVESFYIDDQSDPDSGQFFFAYEVRISNVGHERAQLISREWIITDSDGNVHRVEGPGVVGEQPELGPGESFTYTSFCPLRTPVGVMEGTYIMVRDSGESFRARIAPFTLAVPGVLN